MSPDDELDYAEEAALAATSATAKPLVSLLKLIRPFVDRRAREDTRFSLLAVVVRPGQIGRAGTPVSIAEVLAELGGDVS